MRRILAIAPNLAVLTALYVFVVLPQLAEMIDAVS